MATSQKKVSVWSLLHYAKPYQWLVSLTMLFLLGGRIFASLDPLWLKKIIDGLSRGSNMSQLAGLIGIYFALNILRIVFDYLRDVIMAPAEQGISRSLSTNLYHHLLALPVAFHHEQKIGAISRRMSRGARAISLVIDILVLSVLPTFVELFIVTVLLWRLYNPIYAITTFFTVVGYTVFTVWATDKRQKYRLAANIADDEVSALELDTMTNIETVKYFNNEPAQKKRYEPLITHWYEQTVASNKLFSLIASGQSFILLVATAIILILGINQAVLKVLTIGDLVLLTTYIVRLTGPINALGFVYRQLKDNFTDLEGIARMFSEEITIAEPAHPTPLPNPKGSIVFDKVEFRYKTGRTILEGIDLEVKPGQRVAFVGPSGVGKSTIVKLLFRFFDPTSGQILVDGVPLRELSKETRHNLLAIVPQEPVLFNTTLAENIRFGKPDATLEEIEEAAKLASIDTFIQSLPEKYETVVGERGVKLSGGEKQRVAIARAIIRNPKILVFDEATSSLDSHSEKEIQASLETVSEGRTTLAVAHRLSTIAGSDRIYVLNKGGIAEQGTHQELLKLNGLYAKLWRTQAHGNATM